MPPPLGLVERFAACRLINQPVLCPSQPASFKSRVKIPLLAAVSVFEHWFSDRVPDEQSVRFVALTSLLNSPVLYQVLLHCLSIAVETKVK